MMRNRQNTEKYNLTRFGCDLLGLDEVTNLKRRLII